MKWNLIKYHHRNYSLPWRNLLCLLHCHESYRLHSVDLPTTFPKVKHPTRIPVRLRLPISCFLLADHDPTRLSLIPLSLFYSSITKLFLLFLLTIWLPTSNSTSTTPPMGGTPLPEWTKLISNNQSKFLTTAWQMLDDDKLDREWIIRNVLGGMSAGFGLRGGCASHFSFLLIFSLILLSPS